VPSLLPEDRRIRFLQAQGTGRDLHAFSLWLAKDYGGNVSGSSGLSVRLDGAEFIVTMLLPPYRWRIPPFSARGQRTA